MLPLRKEGLPSDNTLQTFIGYLFPNPTPNALMGANGRKRGAWDPTMPDHVHRMALSRAQITFAHV